MKTAPTSLPAIDRGARQLPATMHARSARRLMQMTSDGHQIAGDRVLVKFRAGVSPGWKSASARAAGGRGLITPQGAKFDVVQVDAAGSVETVAKELAARSDVEYAQPDYRVYSRFVPNDPGYAHQWAFPMLGMESVWNTHPGASSSIIVAVLDTGMAFESATFEVFAPSFRTALFRYPELGQLTLPFAPAPDLASENRFIAPWDFIWGDADPVDLDGHGTHVAGTIGQLTNNSVAGAGMAFNVRLMPVKVLAGDWDQILGAPNLGTDGTVAQGIVYAVDNGARVLNLSLGRDGPPSPVMEEALRYAVEHGAVVTIAAGNSFLEGNPDEVPARYGPAIAGVITVGAVGRGGQRSQYSAVKSYVEVAAPGGDFSANGSDGLIYQQMYDPDAAVLWPITSDMPPNQYHAPRFDVFAFVGIQGTSMAAPHVAGLAALLLHHGVTDPGTIEEAIESFAQDQGAPGVDAEYGAGLINPLSTLRGRGLGIAR